VEDSPQSLAAVLSAGRYLFAIPLGLFGIQHLMYAHAPDLANIPPYTAWSRRAVIASSRIRFETAGVASRISRAGRKKRIEKENLPVKET